MQARIRKLFSFLIPLYTICLLTGCGSYDAYSNALICLPLKSDPAYRPYSKEVSLFAGYLDFEDNTEAALKAFATSLLTLSNAANDLGMRFCIYEGTQAKMQSVANNNQMNYFIWLGHGLNGCVLDRNTSNPICPNDFPKFTSSQLIRSSFMSCQAGQRSDEWRRNFPFAVPNFQMDLSNDNIRISEAKTFLSQTLPGLLRSYLGP